MAIFFVHHGGSNTAPYDTWAKAANTLATAVAAISAGDDIYIGADHSETPGSSVTYAFPGTASAPNRVISVTVGTTTYNKADNIQVDNSAGNNDVVISGYVKFYGFSLKLGDDFSQVTSPQEVLWDDCEIELDRVGGAIWAIGDSDGRVYVRLKNTNVNFSGGGTTSGFSMANTGFLDWRGGTLSWSGTQPDAVFSGFNRDARIIVAGVDFTAITSAIVDVSSGRLTFEGRSCILNSSVALTTGSISIRGSTVLFSGCDDTTGNDLYRLDYFDYLGSIVHDDAIYRTAGASDGADNLSWKMVSTADALEFSDSLVSPPIVVRVDSTGSKTFTVEINHDDATNLQNDEIWLDVEVLDASADTGLSFDNDRSADILATPADQTTSTEAWTGTGGFTNENEQKLEVTATFNRIGYALVYVHLAKPSKTVYVDPWAEIS